jgi:hypothetical protein
MQLLPLLMICLYRQAKQGDSFSSWFRTVPNAGTGYKPRWKVTSLSRVLLGKLTVGQLVKTFFRKTHYRVHKSPRLDPILSQETPGRRYKGSYHETCYKIRCGLRLEPGTSRIQSVVDREPRYRMKEVQDITYFRKCWQIPTITVWGWVLLEKLTVTQTVKKKKKKKKTPELSRNSKVHYRVHKNPPLGIILSQKSPVSTLVTLPWFDHRNN